MSSLSSMSEFCCPPGLIPHGLSPMSPLIPTVPAVLSDSQCPLSPPCVPRADLVARSLLAMPARVSAWRRDREAARLRARADAERRQRLLAEAGLGGLPRPGTAGTPSRASARAQELLDEMERQRRREEKRRRRQEREEAARSALAEAEAAAAARPLPGTAPESGGSGPKSTGESS